MPLRLEGDSFGLDDTVRVRAQVGNNIPIFFIRWAARGLQLLAAHHARAV